MDYVTSLKKANPSQPIVINESLGGPRLDAVEKAALDAAIAAGRFIPLVASAGNAGAGGWPQQWDPYPAKT